MSPVLGVILMVAITVILAAVIAAFVLDLGDTDEAAPTVSFDYDYDSSEDELVVTFESGDEFDADNVVFRGDFDADADVEEGDPWHEASGDINSGDTVGAGDRATLEGLDDDYELDIVFEGPDGDSSDIIGSDTGPGA